MRLIFDLFSPYFEQEKVSSQVLEVLWRGERKNIFLF